MTHIDVTETSFEAEVLQRSFEVPVVVDFWAEWCAPCRALGPVLEKLAGEADGKWRLAKVDVDSNPYIAQTFGIQGIPAVKAFVDGRVAAEFVGALPESQVREWLSGLGPGPADIAFEEGLAAEQRGDTERAVAAYKKALEHQPGHSAAKTRLGALELSARAGGIDEGELRSRLEADPADVDAAMGLADALASRERHEDAFRVLLEVIKLTADDERDRARKHLLALLDMIPADDPRSLAARRELSLVLF